MLQASSKAGNGARYPSGIALLLDYPDPPLRGATFVLRPFASIDFDAAVALAEDPETARWVPPLPALDPAGVLAEFERYRVDGDMLHLVIADVGDDRYLGEVMVVIGDHLVGEVGCAVAAGHRGRGIATEALGLLIRWCLTDLGLGRVQALVAQVNQPGLDLATRLGLQPEGVLRSYWQGADERIDVVMHSILCDEV
ncbi:MAG: GNAT family protein [Acidimicrobiales bacterium]